MKTRPYEKAYIVDYKDGDVSLESMDQYYPSSIMVVSHTVLPDETLHSIAFKYYGDSSYWMYIANFNNLFFPLRDISPGDILQIPL